MKALERRLEKARVHSRAIDRHVDDAESERAEQM